MFLLSYKVKKKLNFFFSIFLLQAKAATTASAFGVFLYYFELEFLGRRRALCRQGQGGLDGLIEAVEVFLGVPKLVFCNFMEHLVSTVLQSVVQGVVQAVDEGWKSQQLTSNGEKGVRVRHGFLFFSSSASPALHPSLREKLFPASPPAFL